MTENHIDDLIKKRFKRAIDEICKVFETNRVKYGDSWLHDGMGPNSLVAMSNAKIQRLKTLCWNKDPRKVDWTKVAEVNLDLALYAILTMTKIDMEEGIDYERFYKIISSS